MPNQSVKVQVSYRSQGLDSWKYSFGQDVNPVDNFHLRMTTNFKEIDFPDNTLAPTEKRETAGGWQLDWNYKNLLSGYAIAMTMPEKLQPGPLAHWYLDGNMQPAASGHPDPKFLRIGEIKYHLWSLGNPPCGQCPTYRQLWMHLQNGWDWIGRLPLRLANWAKQKIKRMTKQRRPPYH